MSTAEQGWGFPLNSRKAHYFKDAEIISICGRWMYSGKLSDDNHNSPDNCLACKRARLAKLKREVAQPAPGGE